MPTVVIFGARGYMGEVFLRMYPGAIAPTVDIADPCAVAKVLDEAKPDIVVNCAGKTGRPNVDWCEDHKEETLHANVIGALVVAEECIKRNVYLVHMSSGCIYAGDGGGEGFRETDPANYAGSFYSRSKAWSDQMLSDIMDHGAGILILRIRMPFDGTTNERNLLMKLRKYTKILDEQNSITCLPDFEKAAKVLIDKRRTGIYHIVNPGPISPNRLMEIYTEVVDPSHRFEKFSQEELLKITKAGRSNCVLNTDKLHGEGITLRTAEQAAREEMQKLKAAA